MTTWNPHHNHPAYARIVARRAQEAADAELARRERLAGIDASKCFDRYRTADRVNNERAEQIAFRRADLNRRTQARMDALHAIEMARAINADPTAKRVWNPVALAAIVCRRHDTSIEYLTERNVFRQFYRDEVRVELRRRVWFDMAAAGISYPEIAAVFGTSHSSIITACRRQEKIHADGLTRAHNGA